LLDCWKCDTRSLFDGEVASAGDLRGRALVLVRKL